MSMRYSTRMISISSVTLVLYEALEGTSDQNALPLVSTMILSLTLYASLLSEINAVLRSVCGMLVHIM